MTSQSNLAYGGGHCANHGGSSAARWWRLFGVIIMAALVARVAWGVAIPVVPVSDSVAYDTFATHLAAGGPYGWDGRTPSAYWPVGTGFIYSLVYRVSDPEAHGYGAVVVLNTLAGLAIVALGMLLTRRWFGWRVGLLTGALLAVWPMHVQFTTVIASELYFTAFLLGGILAWPERWFSGRVMLWRLLLAGALFGAAAYIRPTALLVPAVLAGSAVLRERELWISALKWGMVTAFMLLVILPWSMRNQEVFDRFVLISTNGGPNLWMGNNPESDGGYMPIPERPEHLNEAEFASMLSADAWSYIGAEPGAFARRSVVKALRTHERETIGIAWNIEGLRQVTSERAITAIKWMSQGYWMAVLGLAVAGITTLAFRDGLWRIVTHPAVLVWAYFAAVHAVIVFQDRYHFPVTPMIGALAAAGVVACCQRLCTAESKERVPA